MSRRSSSSRPARKLLWARGSTGQVNSSAASKSTPVALLTGLEGALGHDLVGATIARTRGRFTVAHMDNVTSGFADVAFGLIVYPFQNEQNWSTLPGAYTDRFSSWMGWGALTIPPALGIAVGDSKTERQQMLDYDFKSQRVLRQVNDTLLLSVEGTGTANFTWSFTYSIAVLLP